MTRRPKDRAKWKPTHWIRYLDELFSRAVRLRGKCERCGKKLGVQLQTSHIYSRANKEVRWCFLNATALCARCHMDWHSNPVNGILWLTDYYGDENMAILRNMSRKTRQWWRGEYEKVEKTLLDEIEKYATGSGLPKR